MFSCEKEEKNERKNEGGKKVMKILIIELIKLNFEKLAKENLPLEYP